MNAGHPPPSKRAASCSVLHDRAGTILTTNEHALPTRALSIDGRYVVKVRDNLDVASDLAYHGSAGDYFAAHVDQPPTPTAPRRRVRRSECCPDLASGRLSPVEIVNPRHRFFVVHLLRVEIHRSARRHLVADGDIEHAYEHATVWVELGEDPMRYLMAGPDRSGNILELVVIRTAEHVELVIHAMAMRRSTERELFGRKSR